MPTYNGKIITWCREKSAGKNKGSVDGFYKEDGTDEPCFFVKKPENKVELFAELFAGLLLKEFMERKLIDAIYFPSLICADVIRFDDGSYGLIQPLVIFDELHKIIGTSYSDGSDRSPLKEALWGPASYTKITEQGQYFGLSMALLFSLLLGAYSVHSGNIVRLKNPAGQYGRIDWGDAFRNFAHPENNENILYARETGGWFNFKGFTKNYPSNYKGISGLFPAMAEKALQLQGAIKNNQMPDIVKSALAKIPVKLIEEATPKKLAEYMSMHSFETTTFGPGGDCELFAKEMASVLTLRLSKISELKDLCTQANKSLYVSQLCSSDPMGSGPSPDQQTLNPSQTVQQAALAAQVTPVPQQTSALNQSIFINSVQPEQVQSKDIVSAELLNQVQALTLETDKLRKEIMTAQEQTVQKISEKEAEISMLKQNNERLERANVSLQQSIDSLNGELRQKICAERREKMALILVQIEGIEIKAGELIQRKETNAGNAATDLASSLRAEVRNYIENTTVTEAEALNQFKTNAAEHINKAKKPLEQHRAEWKYILANITLGVLSLGVGYAAATLINKRYTGNYTFFSQTKSGKQLGQLEQSILLNELASPAA